MSKTKKPSDNQAGKLTEEQKTKIWSAVYRAAVTNDDTYEQFMECVEQTVFPEPDAWSCHPELENTSLVHAPEPLFPPELAERADQEVIDRNGWSK